jgi:hypothetical protein
MLTKYEQVGEKSSLRGAMNTKLEQTNRYNLLHDDSADWYQAVPFALLRVSE